MQRLNTAITEQEEKQVRTAYLCGRSVLFAFFEVYIYRSAKLNRAAYWKRVSLSGQGAGPSLSSSRFLPSDRYIHKFYFFLESLPLSPALNACNADYIYQCGQTIGSLLTRVCHDQRRYYITLYRQSCHSVASFLMRNMFSCERPLEEGSFCLHQ